MILSGKSRLAGVMGWPVAHSLSPRVHGYWLDHHGIDGAYVPLPAHPEHLAAALRSLSEIGFRGVNLTIPHKESGLAACHEVDSFARRVGAVNTIVFEAGRLIGSNTDGFGLVESLRQEISSWDPGSAPTLVLGAGGAARAVIGALRDAGSPEIRLSNRTAARARTLASDLDAPVVLVPWAERAGALGGIGLLINTTSLGMTGQGALDLDLTALPATALVTDIVYNPLETPLLAAARARGNLVVDGLGMLLHQARPGFEAWFGIAPKVTAELRAFVLAAQG